MLTNYTIGDVNCINLILVYEPNRHETVDVAPCGANTILVECASAMSVSGMLSVRLPVATHTQLYPRHEVLLYQRLAAVELQKLHHRRLGDALAQLHGRAGLRNVLPRERRAPVSENCADLRKNGDRVKGT